MKKGFTLLELLIVVIIVGILASFAIPQYLRATERAKVGKAKHALGLIAKAEKMYRGEHDGYIDAGPADFSGHDLSEYVELDELDEDPDWDYVAADMGGSQFNLTATRTAPGSKYDGMTITLDHVGAWGGTHDFSGYK